MLRMLTVCVHLMKFVNVEVVEKNNVFFQKLYLVIFSSRTKDSVLFWVWGIDSWWACFLHAA